jgi:hypothetical protein
MKKRLDPHEKVLKLFEFFKSQNFEEATALATELYGDCIGMEIQLLEAKKKIVQAQRKMEHGRIWGGMSWHWNPLHPDIAKEVFDILDNGNSARIEEEKNG